MARDLPPVVWSSVEPVLLVPLVVGVRDFGVTAQMRRGTNGCERSVYRVLHHVTDVDAAVAGLHSLRPAFLFRAANDRFNIASGVSYRKEEPLQLFELRIILDTALDKVPPFAKIDRMFVCACIDVDGDEAISLRGALQGRPMMDYLRTVLSPPTHIVRRHQNGVVKVTGQRIILDQIGHQLRKHEVDVEFATLAEVITPVTLAWFQILIKCEAHPVSSWPFHRIC